MLSLICKLVVNHTHFVHYFRCYSVLAVFLLSLHYPYHIDSLVYLIVMLVFMLSDTKKNGSRAFFCKLWIEICFHTSALFRRRIINTVTDDNNSRVAYAFHSFSTIKNGLPQFCFQFYMCLFYLSSSDFNITTHARILYDCNSSHVPSKNA